MGDIPPDVFGAFLEQQRASQAREARMTARRVLAEMVRQEVADRRLTWRRRRALVRFAERLGLDAFEARLLVRAAEFGVGGDPARGHEQVAREYLAEIEGPGRSMASPWVLLAVLVMNGIALFWLLHRGG